MPSFKAVSQMLRRRTSLKHDFGTNKKKGWRLTCNTLCKLGVCTEAVGAHDKVIMPVRLLAVKGQAADCASLQDLCFLGCDDGIDLQVKRGYH